MAEAGALLEHGSSIALSWRREVLQVGATGLAERATDVGGGVTTFAPADHESEITDPRPRSAHVYKLKSPASASRFVVIPELLAARAKIIRLPSATVAVSLGSFTEVGATEAEALEKLALKLERELAMLAEVCGVERG